LKFKDLFGMVKNSANDQYNYNLKKKKLKKLDLTPNELNEMNIKDVIKDWPKSKVKFFKKKND